MPRPAREVHGDEVEERADDVPEVAPAVVGWDDGLTSLGHQESHTAPTRPMTSGTRSHRRHRPARRGQSTTWNRKPKPAASRL